MKPRALGKERGNMKEWAEWFYKSKEWAQTRDAYTANSKNNSTSTSGSSGLKQTQKPESALCFDKTLAGAYVVTADKLHMRAGAGKTKADYGTIAEGGKVHCYGYYNKEKGTGAKWLYVACGNVTGYCHSDYLKRA